MAVTDEQFAALTARVVRVEKNTGLATDSAPEEVEVPETPEETVTSGGNDYQFTAPSFTYNGTLYLSEDVLENTSLIAALVAQQTSGGTFYPGLLVLVESES
jgi:hypothetical protein